MPQTCSCLHLQQLSRPGAPAAGARLGAYGPIKGLLARGDEGNSLLRNLTAGCISGALAAAVTNPLDLVKVRRPARRGRNRHSKPCSACKTVARGGPQALASLAQTRLQAEGNPYRSSADVIRHAVREQGLRGLWVGSTPSMVTPWATPACAWPMTGGCHCCACNAQPCSAALHTGLPAAAHGSHLCTG